jgi:LysR family glycine cleavage system transcriptional activator
MLRRLPPLNALKAFEAAARHESFTRAAEELCVTQGAVSHQVKALEVELGIKLFNRERQRLVITGAGRDYLNVVRDALDRIAVGTERLMQRQSSGVLTVSTSPDFAAKWLVHRLVVFPNPIPKSICGFQRPCITSTSPERMAILRSGMATATGRDTM